MVVVEPTEPKAVSESLASEVVVDEFEVEPTELGSVYTGAAMTLACWDAKIPTPDIIDEPITTIRAVPDLDRLFEWRYKTCLQW